MVPSSQSWTQTKYRMQSLRLENKEYKLQATEEISYNPLSCSAMSHHALARLNSFPITLSYSLEHIQM